MAAVRVFDVPELLETILVELPMRQLFLVKAVAKSWKATIESSVKVKRIMFLAPDGDVMQCTPKFAKHYVPNYVGLWWFPMMDARPFTPLPLLTGLDELGHDPKSMVWNHCAITNPRADPLQPGTFSAHSFLLRVDRDYGLVLPPICRSMYLCQPPVAAVLLTIHHCEQRENCTNEYVEVVLRDQGGITLGLVTDTFDRMMRKMRGYAWYTPLVTVGLGVDFLMKYANVDEEWLKRDIKQMNMVEASRGSRDSGSSARDDRRYREKDRDAPRLRWSLYPYRRN